jgi:hypothetical protein
MKFGKQFEFYKIPEWSEFYFDYNGIKTVLKFIDIRRGKKKQLKKLKVIKAKLRRLSFHNIKNNINDNKNLINNEDEISTKANKAKESDNDNNNDNDEEKLNPKFSQTFDNEIITNEKKPFLTDEKEKEKFLVKTEKIIEAEDLSGYTNEEKLNKFLKIYKEKISLVNEFLIKKLDEFAKKLENSEKKMKAKNQFLSKEDKNYKKKNTAKLNAEKDEMGYAVSWKRALSTLYNETSWLHSYHSINILAIHKINKKIKKIFKLIGIADIETQLNNIDREFSLFTEANNKIIELRKKIKKLYSDEFTNSDISKASKELEKRLQGTGKMKQTRLIFFYFGVIISSILFLIFLNNIKTGNNKSLSPFFPAFNFGLVIIESLIGCGLVVSILQKYRVNYIYILDLDLNSRLGPADLYQNGFMLLAIWFIILIFMKLSLNFDFFGGNYALFAMILNGLLILFIFFPFHIMYYSFRKGIINVLIRNFFPIGKNAVRFRDFMFGDILTSLNKPFASLVLGYCLMSCIDCQSLNKRSAECTRETIPCLIVLFYPFFIRFTQCINRLYFTGQKWPHLGNTIKYIGGLSNAICAWLYSRYKTDTFLIVHIIVGILSQGYMLFWDIYVDWGLGRLGKNFFLREKIVYPKFWYYGAMTIDAILRFSWTWNFISIDKSYDEWKNTFTAILEAYRRIQWCVFRIENEYWTNPENYRTILAIPELPLD